MTDMEIIVRRINENTGHGVKIRIDNHALLLKYDTGAKNTVISIDTLFGKIPFVVRERIREAFSKRNLIPREFISATGDTFLGYLVCASNVKIDKEVFPKFYYYVVIENKRTLALLGEDFIDNADYTHLRHDDIKITGFDFDFYEASFTDAISEEDMVGIIENVEI